MDGISGVIADTRPSDLEFSQWEIVGAPTVGADTNSAEVRGIGDANRMPIQGSEVVNSFSYGALTY